MIQAAGVVKFRDRLASWAWTTSTRSDLLMWIVGPQRFAGRIARSIGVWESTDEVAALEHATELMNACVRRWPRPEQLSVERIVIRATVRGWAADLTGNRGDVRVVLSNDGEAIEPRVKSVNRPDVSRHFKDRRFDHCGLTFDVDAERIGELGNLSVFAVFDDGSAARLGATENVVETLAGYGVDRWNAGPFPPEYFAVDEPAGHVDDLRVALMYRGSWIEKRRLGLMAMAFGGSADDNWALFSVAVRCGHEFLAEEFLSVGERTGTLTPFERATMLVALARDAEAAQVLRADPGGAAGGVLSAVAPVEHLDHSHFTEVLAASAVEVSLPEVWQGRARGVGATRLEVPPLGVHHVGPATLVRGSTVVVDGRIVLYEDAADPSRGFVAGTWDHLLGFEHRPGISILRAEFDDVVELDEAVLLSGRCDFNHFHFLIEYLPRVGLIDRVSSLEGVPLIVTDELNQSSRDALAALSGNRPIITVSRADMVKVRSLHVPSMHTFVPDSTRIPWIQGCRYSATLMLEMRDRLIDAFPPRGEFGRNVFLARSSSSRGLENGDELVEVALSHGLECVDPGQLSFAQQVDLFSNAALLLGVGGAAYANVIFASEGARALSMVSEQLHDFSMHSTMAELVGVRMTLLLGQTEKRALDFTHRRDYLHASFSVDPKLVDEALASVLR